MAVSVTLTGGGSLIAWQTSSGVSFQRFDANHQPVGAVSNVATGATAWLSAQPLANGGFTIVWDVTANSIPTAQNYDANGVAAGAFYSVSTGPIADIAFTSRANAATPILPDGGTVVASFDRSTENPNLVAVHVQRYDAAGNPLGPLFEQSGALVQWSDFSVAPLPDGGYAVGFVNVVSFGSYLTVLRFDANGTLLGTASPSVNAGTLPPFVNDYELVGLPNGNFVVAWSTHGGVHVREFNAGGQPVTSDRVIASASSSPATLAIDVFPDGDYVVSSTSAAGVQYVALSSAGSPVPAADNDLITTIASTYMLPVGPHDLTLIGNAAQTVTGNVFDNVITSNDFISTLNGHRGKDTLIAGHNANILTGGPDADTFKFLYLPWNNTGHITDFALGVDKLDFSALFASVGYSGTNPLLDGYVRLQDGAGGTRVLFDADGAGSSSLLVLVTTLDQLAPSAGITAAQIFGSGGSTPPPPTTGQTFTANDTRDQILTGGSGNDIFYAGHNSVILTGGGGGDGFVFQHLPWNNTGHITDFTVGTDKLDFTALFTAAGYTGSNPVADGYIRFQSDGAGGTRVLFDADGQGGNPWPFLVTTLDHVSPAGLTAAQIFGSGGSTPPPPTSTGQTFTANNTANQILTGGTGNDIFIAGRNSVVMTGDGGADQFVFQGLPWNGARITDFAVGVDKLDFIALFDAAGYGGTNPIADGLIRFESNGAGDTNVRFDPDGPAPGNRWPFLIVTLEGVQPGAIHSGDWLF